MGGFVALSDVEVVEGEEVEGEEEVVVVDGDGVVILVLVGVVAVVVVVAVALLEGVVEVLVVLLFVVGVVAYPSLSNSAAHFLIHVLKVVLEGSSSCPFSNASFAVSYSSSEKQATLRMVRKNYIII